MKSNQKKRFGSNSRSANSAKAVIRQRFMAAKQAKAMSYIVKSADDELKLMTKSSKKAAVK
ncbi:MAG: hypothetical protein JST27_04650 [Bacteroidetes bacterium]|nr:hypothetical protein [Bacteroidota bacterium]